MASSIKLVNNDKGRLVDWRKKRIVIYCTVKVLYSPINGKKELHREIMVGFVVQV